jgi:hypothetical protein
MPYDRCPETYNHFQEDTYEVKSSFRCGASRIVGIFRNLACGMG